MFNHPQSVADTEHSAPAICLSIILENRRSFTSVWHDDEAAFLAYACRISDGNADLGRDLLAQAAVKLLTYIANHDRPIRHPKALVFRTVKRLGIDRLRRVARDRQIYDHGVDPDDLSDWNLSGAQSASPQRQVEMRQQLDIVYKALGEMSVDTRMIFALRFLEGRSYRDIASALDISNALARKRVQSLRRQLAQALDDENSAFDVHVHRRRASYYTKP